MLTIKKANERGHANHGWLDTWHSFSFASYYDPRNMGFRSLRVINEDTIAGGTGFGTHPHEDMEIFTYMLNGALEHRDSLGSKFVLRPSEVQYMSAGTGIRHSEKNASATEDAHLLQIWLLPNKEGVKPNYGQKEFPIATEVNKLHLIASADGREDSIAFHGDAEFRIGRLTPGASVVHSGTFDNAWVQVARGSVTLNGKSLSAGDAAAVTGERNLTIVNEGKDEAELLLFDLK